MPYQFTDPTPYHYRSGDIFLGKDNQGHEIGVTTERHAICIAGSGTGKGVGLIIPNLLRWPHNVVVIDPKGTNCALTYRARQNMGQKVVALDPFKIAKIPNDVRGGFNPLGGLSPQTPRIREKLKMLADGLVTSHNPKNMDWVAGTRNLIAGLMAYNVAKAPPEHRNLISVRAMLLQSVEDLTKDAKAMLEVEECGGLARAAGRAILSGLASTEGIERDCVNKAIAVTEWLDSPEMQTMLSASSFDMADLKFGNLSLYLVMNPNDITENYPLLFRMVVRAAIEAMMDGGTNTGNRCLFLLDEFYSLGKLDVVAKSAGLMREYGVSLFPFLQDLGQLQELYGAEGAGTFFGNADAHIFFGNSDTLTLQYISDRIGKFTPDEVAPPYEPKAPTLKQQPEKIWNSKIQTFKNPAYKYNKKEPSYVMGVSTGEFYEQKIGFFRKKTVKIPFIEQNRDSFIKKYEHDYYLKTQSHIQEETTRRAEYDFQMKKVGTPRLTPQEIAQQVGKSHADKVAISMVTFAKAGDVLNICLAPFFDNPRK